MAAVSPLAAAAGEYLEARLERAVKSMTARLEDGLPDALPHLPNPHLPKPHLPKLHLPKPHLPKPQQFRRGGLEGSRLAKASASTTRTNPVTIVEDVVVGVPVDVAYEHWIAFQDAPRWSHGIQDVEELDEKTTRWHARMLGARRSWRGTIVEQVPEQRLAWRSEDDDARLRGVLTFHPLAEDATLLLVVMEYQPKGLLEHLGNLVRAQGRRVRLDLKRFRAFVTWQDQPEDGSANGSPNDSADGSADGSAPEEAKASSSRRAQKKDRTEDGDDSAEAAGGGEEATDEATPDPDAGPDGEGA
jgi:uncharacterized membrane protein